MINLFTKTPRMLKGINLKTGEDTPYDIVWFSELWPSRFERKYFRIDYSRVVPVRAGYILDAGESVEVDYSDDTEVMLYPRNDMTLYEILHGIYGPGIHVYPKFPSTEYFLRLEESNGYVNPNVGEHRYLGEYTDIQIPYGEGRLRIHTVKDVEPIVMEIYNDNDQVQKAITLLYVNMCLLRPIPEPSDEDINRARRLWHPDIIKGEQRPRSVI